MPTKPANPQPDLTVLGELPPEIKRLHELTSLFAASSRNLTLEEAKLESEYNALVLRRSEYMLELNAAKERTIKALEDHVRQHPELLGDKRTIKTPVGIIKLVATSELVPGNVEAVINKLYLRADRVEDFDALEFLRIKTTLDLEALEKLDDRVLRTLGIVRMESDSFSFKLVAVNIKEALAASASLPEQQAA